MKVLIVDDDPKLRRTLQSGLAESGIECRGYGDVNAARAALQDDPGSDDLLLLDVMMPGTNGWDFLAELRSGGDTRPVIFLTARQAVDERVRGLRLGADDYVIKPFDLNELLARIEAVVRRRGAPPSILAVGDLTIDPTLRRIESPAGPIELSPREFDLLIELARRPNAVRTRAELLESVWHIDFDPGTNVVDVAIARLRRRLHAVTSPRIETVVQKGYRLVVAPS